MSDKPNAQDPLRTPAKHNAADDAPEKSSHFFSTLAQIIPVGIFRTDTQGNCIYVNECWCKIAGITPAKALGGGWAQAIHPGDREKVAQAWYTSAQAQQRFIMEYRFQRPNGVTRWVQGEAAAERDAAGTVVGYVGTITDITQSKQAEENLRESEVRYRSLFENMLNGFAYCRMQYDDHGCPVDFVYLGVNEAFGRLTGLKNVVGKPVSEVIPGIMEQSPELFDIYGRVASTCIPEIFDFDLKLLGKWFAISVYSPEKGHFVAVFDDITERKRLEAAQLEALDRFQKITQLVPGIVYQFRLRPDGSACVPYASEATREIYRLNPEELREDASKAFTHVHPDDLENHLASIQASARDLTPWQHEYRLKFGDGTVRWLFGNGLPQREADGSTLWHGFITDITGRKEGEERLQQSEGKLRAYLDNISDTIWLIDANLNMAYVSPSVTRLLGVLPEELVGRPSALVIHPDDMGVIANAMRHVMEHPGKPHTIQYRVSHKDGRWIHVESTGVNMLGNPAINGVLVIMRDITERKRVETDLQASEASMRAILDNSPYLVWLKDPEGCYITANVAHVSYARLKDHQQIIGKTDFDLWPKGLAEKYRADDAEVIATRQQKHIEEPSFDGNKMHWVETFKTPIIDEHGKVLGTTGFARDITERKQAEQALAESESRFREIFNTVSDAIFIHDADTGRIIDVNHRMCEMYGLTREEALACGPDDLSAGTPPYSSAEAIEKIHLARTEGPQTFDWLARARDGHLFWVEVSLRFALIGNQQRILAVVRDITERKAAEEQIHNMAFYDSLTQLPNRRLLNDRLEQTMAASKRGGRYGALMFLDMDNFKPLNDTYGHSVGDLLLVEVARRISSCVREMDTVARFGGDEFMVMLSELDDDNAESAAQAGIVAEKIRTTLAKPYVLKIQHEGKAETTVEHHCTSSIGVVLFIGHQGSAEDIVKWADLAMYQAKNAGRNLIRFYA